MWRQHGSNNSNNIEFGDVGSDVGNSCSNFSHLCRKQKLNKDKDKWIKLACAVGIAFSVGLSIGQYMLKRSIVDDCRILKATRFGEVFISCGTIQKL